MMKIKLTSLMLLAYISVYVHAEEVCIIEECIRSDTRYDGYQCVSDRPKMYKLGYFNDKIITDRSPYDNGIPSDAIRSENLTYLTDYEQHQTYSEAKWCFESSDYLVEGENLFFKHRFLYDPEDFEWERVWNKYTYSLEYENEAIFSCDILFSRDTRPLLADFDEAEEVRDGISDTEYPNICNLDFSFSLEDIDPALARRLERARSGLQDLIRSYNDIENNHPGRIDEVITALDQIASIDFENIDVSDLVNIESAVGLYEDLNRDLSDLQDEPQRLRNEVSEEISDLDRNIDLELSQRGVDPEDFPPSEFSVQSAEIFIPVVADNGIYESENNVYQQYAQRTLAELQQLYYTGEDAAFILLAREWLDTVKQFRDVLANRSFQSPTEWRDFTNAYGEVYNYVFSILDFDFWYKDSPVSISQRQSIDSIKEYYPAQGDIIETEIKTWRGQVVTDEQLAILKTLEALGNGLNSVVSSGQGVSERMDNLVTGAAIAVVEGVKCVTTIVALGDFGDLYEIVSGRSLCGGEELTVGERAFSALGLIAGNGAFWRGVGRTLGILGSSRRVAHMTASVAERARRLEWSDEEVRLLSEKFRNSACSI